MRKLSAFIVLFCPTLALSQTSLGNGWTNTWATFNTGSTGVSAVNTGTINAHDFLAAFCDTGNATNNGGANHVSDDNGDTWVQAPFSPVSWKASPDGIGGNATASFYYVLDAHAGANGAVHFTCGGSSQGSAFADIAISAYRSTAGTVVGLDGTNSAVVQTSSGTCPAPLGGTGNLVPSISVTTAKNADLIVEMAQNNGSGPQGQPSGWIWPQGVGYFFVRSQTSAGAISLSYCLGVATDPTNNAVEMMAAFTTTASGPLANVYIGQASAGSGDGSSCANQKAVTFYNTSGNWGSGSTQIGQDTTIHLCGNITTQLTTQGSGASGHPITIKFESGAHISIPACDNINGCLDIDGKSWLVIDGGTPCGPSTTCATNEDANYLNATPGTGYIESTNNGATLSQCLAHNPCQNIASSKGISAVGSSNIEIKNLIVRNMFVHTSCFGNESSTACNINLDSDSGIFFGGSDVVSFSIHDSTIHDGRELVTFITAPNTNSAGPLVYNVDLFHTAGAFKMANSSGTATVTGTIFHDSHIHDLNNWDAGNCVDAYHLDGLHWWSPVAGSGGTGTNTNQQIYNNKIDGNFGQCQTGTMFLEGENDNTKIFNNAVVTTYTQNNNGMMNVNGTGFEIYNNVINGSDTGGDLCFNVGRPAGSPSIKFQNNIVAGCNTLVLTQNGPTITTWNNNIYGQCNNSGCNSGTPFVANGSSFDTFAAWKSGCSCDAASQFNGSMTFAKLNASGSLQLGSPAIAAGANLTSLGITALNSDILGISRPASAAWDDGAFQFGVGFSASPTTIPSKHSNNIAVTLTGSGTSWTGSTAFSVSGVTGVTLVSKSNSSATSETLQITTTASGTGTLTITDTTDTLSTTITVALATLIVSPTTSTVNLTPSVTLTGTNTLWLSETPAGLFSVSGGTGSSIGTPTVTTNTSATATLTVGSAAGAEVITDTSTTATTNFTVTDVAIAPSIAPVAGTYVGTQTITITDSNGGTHVTCYTQNGATPATNGDGVTCATGTVYSGTFLQAVTGTVKAISGTSTKLDSTVTSNAYVINPSMIGTSVGNGARFGGGVKIR